MFRKFEKVTIRWIKLSTFFATDPRTRSENPLLSNGGRRIMFVRLSEMPRKNAHSTTPRKKTTQKQTKTTTRATCGSPSNYQSVSLFKRTLAII